MYGYATPFRHHFNVVFDVRVLDLNLSNVTKAPFTWDRDEAKPELKLKLFAWDRYEN